MSHYSYNRKMKNTHYQISSPRTNSKQLLVSTQNNLTKYQSSKHEIYSVISRRRNSCQSNRIQLHNYSLDSINKNHKIHPFNCKMIPPCYPEHFTPFLPFPKAKPSLNLKMGQQVRDTLKQTILLNKKSFTREDCFPLFRAKKFNPIKIQKLRKRCNQMDAKQQRQTNDGSFLYQPWEISEQQYDAYKF